MPHAGTGAPDSRPARHGPIRRRPDPAGRTGGCPAPSRRHAAASRPRRGALQAAAHPAGGASGARSRATTCILAASDNAAAPHAAMCAFGSESDVAAARNARRRCEQGRCGIPHGRMPRSRQAGRQRAVSAQNAAENGGTGSHRPPPPPPLASRPHPCNACACRAGAAPHVAVTTRHPLPPTAHR